MMDDGRYNTDKTMDKGMLAAFAQLQRDVVDGVAASCRMGLFSESNMHCI
jgi:hypothetical protein